MKIAAVVVTYNRKDLLKENIEALLRQSYIDLLDIVIIDNASTDGTGDLFQKYQTNERVIYLNTGDNLGGAGGFQYGIRYAAEEEYDYVWVMDDDCIPTATALEEFIEMDKRLNGDYGFLSSKVLWKNGEVCKMNIQRKTLWRNVRNWENDLVPIIMASFVSLFIPIKNVKKFGLPIKEFFIWTDDWEYTRRISLKEKCYLVNKSVVVHKSKNNLGANIVNDDVERLERYNFLYRNDVYLYRREKLNGLLYEFIRLIKHVFSVVLFSKDNKLSRIKKIINGTIAGIYFLPQIKYLDNRNYK